MSFQTRSGLSAAGGSTQFRSALSSDFEMFWRGLPKAGLVPERAAFRPERAQRFLRHIVLLDVGLEGEVSIRIRLTGSEFDARLQHNVRGHDYLQYMPKAHHAATRQSVREIVQRPCGLWQIMSVHYRRGFSQNTEITVFPLRSQTDGAHQLLVLTQTADGLVTPNPSDDKPLTTDTALTYQYIDIGAGVPLP